MKLSVKALDIFFRRIAPEQVLFRAIGILSLHAQEQYKWAYMSIAETTLSGYSFDEQMNIYNYCCQIQDRYTSRKNLPPFYLLVEFANSVFSPNDAAPICRYEEVLNWRDAYLLLGQDLFTTSWLAHRPVTSQGAIRFSWPAIIPVDNQTLARITAHMAENHLHLYAGASTFALTWSCLMNHPHSVFDLKIDELLQLHTGRDLKAEMWSLERRTLYAAFIRALLFHRLFGENGETEDVLGELRRFHAGYVTDKATCITVTRKVEYLRRYYGLWLEQPGASPACLDYALSKSLSDEQEEHSRLLAGERFFLYSCFTACFSDTFSQEEQWLFYAYLLLKSQFRSEFVQVNRQVGFHNFSAYDKRKKVAWKKFPEYWNEDIRQAINAAIVEQKISYLEGRICPESSATEDISIIHKIDKAKLFFDTHNREERFRLETWNIGFKMKNPSNNDNHSFVMHFPKRSDQPLPQMVYGLVCRHFQYRIAIRSEAIQLAKALSNYDYLCHRIRGIDACSSEIGCRPEVFAPVFRYLRRFPVQYYRKTVYSREFPLLSITYHAGEDFLDISDGLRAIDEAMCFLGMDHGDRFGHALALGVDPVLHYNTKHMQCVMSKQDFLDNLTWVIFRSPELGVVIGEPLLSRLLSRANSLLNEIYIDILQDKSVSLEDYYHSMLLRGDDPACYRSGQFHLIPLTDPFDSFALNDNPEFASQLDLYRRQGKINELYFCYHYSLTAKRIGQCLDRMDITEDYIALMAKLQIAMQHIVNDKGISIECNPSSNVLIGTFSYYRKHPILNFNNMGLNLPNKAVQMHVSINSDDPGVFDTSLAFEYALLARALSEIRDTEGKPIHTERQIESYLRNLVHMGQEQRFPSIESQS